MRWLKSTRDGIVSGLALFAILASATAVLRLIDSLTALSFGEAIRTAIYFYESFFYPFVDLTIGKLLYIFQISISDWQKDIFIAYSLISSSIFRFLQSRKKEKQLYLNYIPLGKSNEMLLVIYSLIWPVFLPLIIVFSGIYWYIILEVLQNSARRAADGVDLEVPWRLRLAIYFSSIWTIIIPAAAEILKVLAIAVVAIFLDAADAL